MMMRKWLFMILIGLCSCQYGMWFYDVFFGFENRKRKRERRKWELGVMYALLLLSMICLCMLA